MCAASRRAAAMPCRAIPSLSRRCGQPCVEMRGGQFHKQLEKQLYESFEVAPRHGHRGTARPLERQHKKRRNFKRKPLHWQGLIWTCDCGRFQRSLRLLGSVIAASSGSVWHTMTIEHLHLARDESGYRRSWDPAVVPFGGGCRQCARKLRTSCWKSA